VDRVILVRTWRVAKPYVTADVLDPREYRPLLQDGLMQSRRTHEPRLVIEPLFKPFVEDKVSALLADTQVRLVAHPTAERSIASVQVGFRDRVALAIGPEGGFIPYEVEALTTAGFVPVSMGPHPLRVETACVALLAQLDLLRTQGAAR
jgi:RsmE family RNA methyltransferase